MMDGFSPHLSDVGANDNDGHADKGHDIGEVKADSALNKPPPLRAFVWAELPAELRNQIYDLALTSPYPVAIIKGRRLYNFGTLACYKRNTEMIFTLMNDHDSCSHDTCKHKLAPNLLLANKQTYNEGISFLYSNELYFGSRTIMYHFFNHSRRRANANKYVKRLTLPMDQMNYHVSDHIVGMDLDSLTLVQE
ncbi:short-chain dehydrogenase reductase sdr protein [Diplodia corticola]|uniref:Short-chain dehydrogenase reductase sdr protein n=1 Tax=Diplodia corticola TaxID=236234 RepID=A0A1J9S358_9PEZI|nr:short-chain dehydrogenase reductase sdr protein [Diplodia corticola]OJD34991.1 short-chain dehydrogenase reductase sdr protein [Diplodia corticola]